MWKIKQVSYNRRTEDTMRLDKDAFAFLEGTAWAFSMEIV